MNDETKTMTADELHDEITCRLGEAAGTAFMLGQAASAACCDIPSNAPVQAGYGLQRELQEIRDLCGRMHSTRLAEERAAAKHDAPAAPSTLGGEALDMLHEIDDLSAEDKRAVLNAIRALTRGEASKAKEAPAAPAPDQDEDEAAMLASLDARNRRNQFFTDNTQDTLHRVAGGLALLSRVDDSEDHDPDADTGKLYLIESMRCALDAEAARISKLHEAARLAQKAAE